MMAVAVLFTASCAKEDISSSIVGNGEAVEVTFSANLPDLGTRANEYGSGAHANTLQFFVYQYDESNETVGTYLEKVKIYTADPNDQGTNIITKTNGNKFYFSLTLVKGMRYNILFWADKGQGSIYSVDSATGVVTANYKNNEEFVVNANDEYLDAFFGSLKNFDPADDNAASRAKTIELKRPFAQLNVITKDYAQLAKSGVVLTQSKVVGYVPTTLNVFDGTLANETTEVTFDFAGIPTDEVADDGQTPLSMNYILAPADQKFLADITIYYKGSESVNFPAANYSNIPLKRNYKTNIIGDLLTKPTEFEVEIKTDFNKPAEEVDVWDGESLTEPASTTENNQTVYAVASGSDLAWLAAYLNGTLNASTSSTRATVETFNIVLDKDIELGGQEWTPIGTSANPFKGTFDGNGHIIKNLVVTGGSESNKGLFGYTTDGEVKNLTIQDAKVSGRLNVGVVAGTPYTSKYTNITVKGHVEVNGLAYVGGVGGKNAYADWTNITVDVDETSYVKANSIENGTAYRTYVGGVVGFNGEGGHSFKNITSNINVEGSTCDVGGLFGIAHYDNKFENCECTGNVKINAAEEADEAQEIGGIAGVWHNATGYSVTMTNCVFSGELTTNIPNVVFCNGGLVGKAYGDGEGKLTLNGLEITKDGVNLAVINEALATGNGYTLPFNVTGKATASNAYGATGLNQLNGGVLDGDGHTLKVTGAGGTWASAINTTGGTIQNITVAQGFRGIFVNHNSSHSETVVLKNVTINGPTYTISCDQGMNQGLEAYDCTINGWTSYAATIGEAYFENCSFGKGAGYKFARPYAATEFVGCNFCEGYEIDARAKISFLDCTLNGVALTEENLATLVTGNSDNASIVTKVSTADELVAALAEGKGVYLLNDIKMAASKGGYSKAGILQNKAQTIDGGGHTLTVTGAGATWDCAIYTNGGTIKNLTVAGAMRGIFTAGQSSDLHIENVKFKNVIYTFNSDGNMPANPFGVYVSNSTVNGWTSHSDMHTEVVYTNCSFGEGSGYKYCRPYGKTAFVNCTFCAGYTVDESNTNDITYTDCTFAE